jgi:hypothetical protein
MRVAHEINSDELKDGFLTFTLTPWVLVPSTLAGFLHEAPFECKSQRNPSTVPRSDEATPRYPPSTISSIAAVASRGLYLLPPSGGVASRSITTFRMVTPNSVKTGWWEDGKYKGVT